MHRIRTLAVGLFVLLALAACSHQQFDPFNRGRAFDDAQKRFTRLIRWNQFDKASSYVAPDARAEFLNQAAALSDVRFTDYDVLDVQVGDGFRTATVDVVYRAYANSNVTERAVAIRQKWERDEFSSQWRVRPQLAELPRTFSSEP